MSVEIQDDEEEVPQQNQQPKLPKQSLIIHHPWHNVNLGPEYPDSIHVVIEIPALSRVKTELHKPTGLLKVDRILHSSVVYPANYGLIPKTLAEDGDPLDILVLCQLSIPPLTLIKARPIGVMPLLEQGQADDKIIAVAVNDPEYNIYHDISELPPFKMLIITQFFLDYKKLEGKEVKARRPQDCHAARRIIEEDVQRYKKIYGTK
ncbi:hypothetical protein M9Y10_044635 [Tritrichomonas musculus]|uniref:inorganic diphosphatase n=1 Tax=Tritrichomonas musculus TaxID=1915356 RepID=A0ABR2JSX9_9EUKA